MTEETGVIIDGEASCDVAVGGGVITGPALRALVVKSLNTVCFKFLL